MRFGFGAEADQAAQTWCTHASCQEDQARDLGFMASALNRPELRELAAQAHNSTVRCRHQPRKGPVRAPLTEREGT
jgi:hypothetical protein